jgi:hypothetical protein
MASAGAHQVRYGMDARISLRSPEHDEEKPALARA